MSARASTITIISLTVAVEVAMLVTDMGPNVLLVGALCLLGGTSWWLFSELSTNVARPAPPPAISDYNTRPNTDRRVWVLRDTLLGGRHRDEFDARLHQTLVDVIDDRLATAHNVERHQDPPAAEAILGAELSAFVSGTPMPDGLTRNRHIDHIVTLIEGI